MNRKQVKTGEKLTIEGYASRSGYYGEFGKKLLAVPALALKDVKNEDRPGYVYENKGDDDKMSS